MKYEIYNVYARQERYEEGYEEGRRVDSWSSLQLGRLYYSPGFRSEVQIFCEGTNEETVELYKTSFYRSGSPCSSISALINNNNASLLFFLFSLIITTSSRRLVQ